MKPEILFYSDCPFFAGCENMIANLLNSSTLQTEFSLSFAYSSSSEYEQGLNVRVSNTIYRKYPLQFKKQKLNLRTHSLKYFEIFHRIARGIYLIFYKYYSIIVNTLILYKFFRKRKIDILHINNGGYPAAYSCYSAVIAARLVGVKNVIYVVNNIPQDYKNPFRWLDYPIDFFIREWVTVFITGSVYAGEKLKETLRLNNNHLAIPNGIRKREITLSKEQFIVKYNVPEGRLIATLIANLEKRKGHIFLYEAIKQIQSQYEDSSIPFFIIEGSGPEKLELEKYVANHKLEKYIWMVDHIPDIFNLLNASDFIILPSIFNEDFPNVVLEAMSLGKPVIGTSIAGIPEQVDNFKTGIIVEPQNAEALKNAIMELVLNPDKLKEYAQASKLKFDALFTESISVNKYIDLYRSLIK